MAVDTDMKRATWCRHASILDPVCLDKEEMICMYSQFVRKPYTLLFYVYVPYLNWQEKQLLYVKDFRSRSKILRPSINVMGIQQNLDLALNSMKLF